MKYLIFIIILTAGACLLFFSGSPRFANTPPTRPLHRAATLSALWQMFVLPHKFVPPRPLPFVPPDWTALQAADTMRFIWFGHSTLLLRVGGQTVLIDPVFAETVSPVPRMMRRFQAAGVSAADLPHIDWVVYSHNHYDHLDEAVLRQLAARPQIRFAVPAGMSGLLRDAGVAAERIWEAQWWQSRELAHGLRLHAVPARHNSGRGLTDKNRSLWAGWVLETADEKIYYSGDSSYGGHFADIGRRFGGFDWAFVENGQYNAAWEDNHMFPEQTARAVRDVGAARFVPVHWGAYALSTHAWNEPVRRSVPLVRQAGIAVHTPRLGEVRGRDGENRDWWNQ